VRDALEAYLADLRRHGRAEAANEALWRFRLAVYEDTLADIDTVNRYVRAVVAGLNHAMELGHVGTLPPGA